MMPTGGEQGKSSRSRRKRRLGGSKTKRRESNESVHRDHQDDVLEQLERQRRKQDAARGSMLDDLSASPRRRRSNSGGPKKRLGRFEFCSECRSYYPLGQHSHERDTPQHRPSPLDAETNRLDNSTLSRCRFPPFSRLDLISPRNDPPVYQRRMENLRPFLDFSYVARSCAGAHLRFRRELIEQWRFQMLSSSMRVTSPLILPSSDYEYTEISRPSCRTFDCLGQSTQRPSIVADLRDGDLFFTNFRRRAILEDDAFRTVHTVRKIKDPCGQSEQDVSYFGRIVANPQSGETVLEWSRLSLVNDETEKHTGEVTVACRWNDFCSSRDGKRLIVVGEPWNSKNGVWIHHFEAIAPRLCWHGNIRRFPLSDALCVESIDDTVFCIGHLNGQVTLWDDRIRNEGSTASTYMLNILRIRPVEPYQILVRGGGCAFPSASQSMEPICQLWDVRNLKNMIHDFSLPSSRERVRQPQSRLATFRSNGVVSDPARTIVLAPWVGQVENRQTPQLGVWSLTSGDYLGSRELVGPNKRTNESQSSQILVELSDSITAGGQFTSEDKAGGLVEFSICPGSFGLWYRVREQSAEGLCCGDIHHVAIDGRLA